MLQHVERELSNFYEFIYPEFMLLHILLFYNRLTPASMPKVHVGFIKINDPESLQNENVSKYLIERFSVSLCSFESSSAFDIFQPCTDII